MTQFLHGFAITLLFLGALGLLALAIHFAWLEWKNIR